MRTGHEIARPKLLPLDELELQIRYLGADLTQALARVPVDEEITARDRELVGDIHWSVSEALRLCVDYRRRLVDRLPGSTTPAQGSSPQSLHDPPPHVTPGKPESTGEPSTP